MEQVGGCYRTEKAADATGDSDQGATASTQTTEVSGPHIAGVLVRGDSLTPINPGE